MLFLQHILALDKICYIPDPQVEDVLSSAVFAHVLAQNDDSTFIWLQRYHFRRGQLQITRQSVIVGLRIFYLKFWRVPVVRKRLQCLLQGEASLRKIWHFDRSQTLSLLIYIPSQAEILFFHPSEKSLIQHQMLLHFLQSIPGNIKEFISTLILIHQVEVRRTNLHWPGLLIWGGTHFAHLCLL